MSKNLNKVTISGNLVRDPESKFTATGKQVCNFSIANNRDYGENKKVNYFDVFCWEKTADACMKYLKKGMKVNVDGELNQDTWEKDGQTRSRINIKANEIEFIFTGNNENKPAPMKDPYENQEPVNFDDVKDDDSIPF